MASTFTTNSDLEKPATGEQQGTWGATANRNYDKIDSKLNSVLGLNANTSPTITNSQIAVSRFDSQIIRCSGTLTADRTMTFPSGKQGRFTIDLKDVVFNTKTFVLKCPGDIGVTVTSSNDKIFGIYTNGTSVRKEGPPVSPFIAREIRMYAPTSTGFVLPTGWYVCNGQNGTPDLRNKFIRGGAQMNAVSTGGSDTKTINIPVGKVSGNTGSTALTSSMIPSHYHHMFIPVQVTGVKPTNLTANNYCAAAAGFGDTASYILNNAPGTPTVSQTSRNIDNGTTGHTHTVNLATSIKSVNIDAKPAYFSLVFIMYKGS